MLERIPCTICPQEIVIHAGQTHDGICRFCRDLNPQERAHKARFYRALASGEAYSPSDADIASAHVPPEWDQHHRWTIEPNWFSESFTSLEPLLAHAANGPEGYVTCTSDRDSTFLIASNDEHAVCVYQTTPDDSQYFAYTEYNLQAQVDRERHLCSTCPCCGILQGGYFPSRFHSPKDVGFEIARRILLGSDCNIDVTWIPSGDCRWTDAGIG